MTGKTLLAITTANQLEYTKLCFNSLAKCDLSNIDVVVIDDASKDGTFEYCHSNDIKIITKERSLGLTHSWNLAYNYFKKGNYENIIIANNDVLIAPTSLENLLAGLTEYAIVGPMSTRKGVHHQPLQALEEYYLSNIDHTKAENYLEVQEYLNTQELKETFKELPFLNGFFFACNKDVVKYEYSETELFDPTNINIANEDELCNKVKEPKAVCLNSFIFHFKGVSFKDFTLSNGYLLERNLTWEDVEKLKKQQFSFQLYRLKRKIKSWFS